MQRNSLRYFWWLRHACIIIVVLALNGLIPLNVAALPDLRIKLSEPKTVHPGDELGENLTVVVYNRGNEPARGTKSRESGFMVDIFKG
ncbi:MAG: hypothetical protein SWO11_06650 [Thermodesulfobacteriota bacterium]|nr:hypothetical protein [Thermodesulfobacteriota bacterium]